MPTKIASRRPSSYTPLSDAERATLLTSPETHASLMADVRFWYALHASKQRKVRMARAWVRDTPERSDRRDQLRLALQDLRSARANLRLAWSTVLAYDLRAVARWCGAFCSTLVRRRGTAAGASE